MSDLTILEVTGDAETVGAAHGQQFGEDIRAYLEKRRTLSLEGTDLDAAGVTAIAEDMVDAHLAYDDALFDEMAAMAAAGTMWSFSPNTINTGMARVGSTLRRSASRRISRPPRRAFGAGRPQK